MPQHPPDPDLLDATLAAFQPLTDEPLTRDDAVEIVDNLARFGSLVQRWALRRAVRRGELSAEAAEELAVAEPRSAS